MPVALVQNLVPGDTRKIIVGSYLKAIGFDLNSIALGTKNSTSQKLENTSPLRETVNWH